jgi:ribosomal protein S18 acetylase RimI-like enzyme
MNLIPTIRVATIDDAEMLNHLSARTFYDAFASMNSPENIETYMRQHFTVEQFSSQLTDARAAFLIAEIEGKPIAYAKLYAGDAPDCVKGYAAIEIERFYVDQQYHGSGIAHLLMQACFDRAKRAGHETVYLGVWEHNQRAIAFYRKWGFEIIGAQIFRMGDEAQNDFLMERKL